MKKLFVSITPVILMVLSLALLPGYGQENQQERGDASRRSDTNIPRLLERLLDLNKDGKLTRIESVKFFRQANQNRDRFLTEDEIREAMNGPNVGHLPGHGQENQQKRRDASHRSDTNIPRLLVRLFDLNQDGKLTRVESVRFLNLTDLNRNGFLAEDEIREAMNGPNVGQKAPDFALTTLDGLGTVELSDFRGKKPVVLVFASDTWSPFRSHAGALERIYQQYKSKSKWLLIYIKADDPDGRQVDVNVAEVKSKETKAMGGRLETARTSHSNLGLSFPVIVDANVAKAKFRKTKAMEERLETAHVFYSDLGISFPTIVDNMDDEVEEAYAAWPGRLYIVDKKGKIAYKGRNDPKGFNLQEMAEKLKRICGK